MNTPILHRAAAFFLPAGLAVLAVVAAIAARLWPAGPGNVVADVRS